MKTGAGRSKPDMVRAFFDQIAERYDEENYVVGPARPAAGRQLLSHVSAVVETLPHGEWVDLGCGTGRALRLLAERGHGVIGIDCSSQMLNHARQNAATDAMKLEESDVAAWLEARATHSLDGILALELLPFLAAEAEARVLRQVVRVLRPEGRLVVSSYNALAELFRFDRVTIQRWEEEVLPVLVEGDADVAAQLSLGFRGLLAAGEYPAPTSRGQQRQIRLTLADLEVRRHDPLAFALQTLPGAGLAVTAPPAWYGVRPVPPVMRAPFGGIHDMLVRRAESAAAAGRLPAHVMADRFVMVARPVTGGA